MNQDLQILEQFFEQIETGYDPLQLFTRLFVSGIHVGRNRYTFQTFDEKVQSQLKTTLKSLELMKNNKIIFDKSQLIQSYICNPESQIDQLVQTTSNKKDNQLIQKPMTVNSVKSIISQLSELNFQYNKESQLEGQQKIFKKYVIFLTGVEFGRGLRQLSEFSNSITSNSDYLESQFLKLINQKNLTMNEFQQFALDYLDQGKKTLADESEEFLLKIKIKENLASMIQLKDKKLQQEIDSFIKKKIECCICQTPIFFNEIFSLFKCQHIFHLDCLCEQFKSEINEQNIKIKCSFKNCNSMVTDDDVKSCVNQELYDKYMYLLLESTANENPEFLFRCMTKGCQFIAFYEDSDTLFNCELCKKRYCIRCQVTYHEGERCKDYKERSEIEASQSQIMRKSGKQKCPSCKIWVEKISGCNHMTCNCKFQFCYICGEQWKQCNCSQ